RGGALARPVPPPRTPRCSRRCTTSAACSCSRSWAPTWAPCSTGIAERGAIPEEDLVKSIVTIVLAAGPLATFLTGAPQAAPPPVPYQLAARTPLAGEGGWDYLTFDAGARRLFVTRSSHVQVVDAAHDSLVGDIPGTNGVHGVALVPDVGHGFTSN